MWSSLIPFVGVILLLLFVPGVLVNLVAGFRGWQAVGFAPLVSTAVIAVAAIIWQPLAVAWGPLPILGTTVLAAGFAITGRILGQRLAGAAPAQVRSEPYPALAEVRAQRASKPLPTSRPPHPAQDGATAAQRRPASMVWTLGGWAIGAVLMTRDFMTLTGGASNFSQTFDNIFHLNAVRWITDHRMASSLDMRMTSGLDTPAGFYPTGWHDIASGALITMGSTDVVRVTSALALVVVAIVWPLGCLLLGRRLLHPTPLNQLAIGALSASFPAFPYLILGFGVLYPNLLGLCLLPAVVALGIDILGLGTGSRVNQGTLWATALMGMAALSLSHPNVALTMVDVIGVILIVCWALPVVWQAARTRTWTRKAKLRGLVLAGWLVGAAVALKVIRPPMAAGRWEPYRTYWDALVETVAVSPLDSTMVLLPALLVVIGAAVEIARRSYLLVLLHAGMCFMWFVAASFPISFPRDLIVGPWYGDSYRLASLLALFAVPLAAIGLEFVVSLALRMAPGIRRHGALVAVIAVALLIGASQFGTGKSHVLAWANSYYGLNARPGGTLVTADEYELIRRLPDSVPAAEIVAVNPWNGGSMAYALAGVHTNHTHVLYTPTKADKLINNQLNQAATKPVVCQALASQQVGWVLDFGNTLFLNGVPKIYPGYWHLDAAEGFEEVDHEGDAVLYRITACR